MENGDVLKVLDSQVAGAGGTNQHKGGSVGPTEAPKTSKELAEIAGVSTASIEDSKDQTSKELGLNQVSKQPSPQAIEIAARMMARRAIRRDREDGNF